MNKVKPLDCSEALKNRSRIRIIKSQSLNPLKTSQNCFQTITRRTTPQISFLKPATIRTRPVTNLPRIRHEASLQPTHGDLTRSSSSRCLSIWTAVVAGTVGPARDLGPRPDRDRDRGHDRNQDRDRDRDRGRRAGSPVVGYGPGGGVEHWFHRGT